MSKAFDRLVNIMQELRSPTGCPWDKEQNHQSILNSLIEEAYEFIDAAQVENYEHMCEELGDVLLQIVFHAQMAKEENHFTIDDVVNGISEKMIRRHPHVFKNNQLESADEVSKQWDEIKELETKNYSHKSILDSVPRSLPGLFEAFKLTKKASKQGFDWNQTQEVLNKIDEEILELKAAVQDADQTNIKEEIGDLFFTLANLCRFVNVNPEEAINLTNVKFRNRFQLMEQELVKKKLDPKNLTLEEWDSLWESAKDKE